VRGRFFVVVTLTLKLEGALDILKMYLYTKYEVARLRHSKLLTVDKVSTANTKKYENSSQSQMSRSNVTNIEALPAFTVAHAPT